MDIWYAGSDGPFSLSSVALFADARRHAPVDSAADAHTTAPYSMSEFDPPAVRLSASFADSAVDTDADGLFDLLRISATTEVDAVGVYRFFGQLYAGQTPVPATIVTATLEPGSHPVNLDFSGREIYFARQDGPYRLGEVLVSEEASGDRIHGLDDAYTTGAYVYTVFENSGMQVGATGDWGVDVHSQVTGIQEPLYEYLDVGLEVTGQDGESPYTLSADLTDPGGTVIASTQTTLSSDPLGPEVAVLRFPGGAIREHGVEGPFRVTSLSLLDRRGEALDFRPLAHVTQAYAAMDFAREPVGLGGSYRDTGIDIDGDGLYDYIEVRLDVSQSETGRLMATAELADGSLTTAVSTAEAVVGDIPESYGPGGLSQVVLRFAGGDIWASQVDGPYKLVNLFVYHEAYPYDYVFVPEAYTTPTYSWQQFNPPVSPLVRGWPVRAGWLDWLRELVFDALGQPQLQVW